MGRLEDQKDYFNSNYKSWINSIDDNKKKVIEESIKSLGLGKNITVLDIGCGTGILYPFLMGIPVKEYMGLDISERMVEEFSKKHKNVNLKICDFQKEIDLNRKFDTVLIFDSIPHFEDLDTLFINAGTHLESNGRFSIIHSRTREELKKHHRKINFSLGREAIPLDADLEVLCDRYGFDLEKIKDDDFFFFSCIKL